MEFSCQPELKVRRPCEIPARLSSLLWMCWIVERMPQTDQLFRTAKGFQNTQAWSLTSQKFCKNGNSSLADTGSSLRQEASLFRNGMEAHLTTELWEEQPQPTAWQKTCQWYPILTAPNSHHSAVVGSSHTQWSQGSALKICSFPVYFYFHFFANRQQSQGKHPTSLHKRQTRFILAKESHTHQVLC